MSDEKPGYVVVLATQLREGNSVTIQFNMPVGAEPARWNGELDKLMAVLDRQEARSALPALRNQLKHHELTAEVIEQDIAKMLGTIAKAKESNDTQRRNQVNTQSLEQNVEAQKGALEKAKKSADEMRKIIAETEQKAA